MARSSTERQLTRVGAQLTRARAELAVLDEQLAVFADTADDTRVRALVSESARDGRDHRDAQRHADAMARSRAHLLTTIAELERTIDELLERLVPSR